MVAKSKVTQNDQNASNKGNDTVNDEATDQVKEVLPDSITDPVNGEITEKDPARMSVFDDASLSELASFEDAVSLLGGTEHIIDSRELGSGFEPTDKDQLIGVPMLFVQWKFHTGDTGEYVVVFAMTKDNRKVIFTDGSQGIYKDLRTMYDTQGTRKGLFARNGLTRSDYQTPDGKNAHTFYVA